jgi:hypothetical protein
MAERDGEDKEPRLDLHGVEEELPYCPRTWTTPSLVGEQQGMSIVVGNEEAPSSSPAAPSRSSRSRRSKGA